MTPHKGDEYLRDLNDQGHNSIRTDEFIQEHFDKNNNGNQFYIKKPESKIAAQKSSVDTDPNNPLEKRTIFKT